LPGVCDADDIFMVIGSKVKVTDGIFKNVFADIFFMQYAMVSFMKYVK